MNQDPAARSVQSSINRCNVVATSSTRRNPSAFEYSSTALLALPQEVVITCGAPPSSAVSTRTMRGSSQQELTIGSTRMEIICKGSTTDQYEVGTAQPRAYDCTSFERNAVNIDSDNELSDLSDYHWTLKELAEMKTGQNITLRVNFNEFNDNADVLL